MKLLEKKHRENLDLNTNIQNRKDFRNPRWVHEGMSLSILNTTIVLHNIACLNFSQLDSQNI